MKKNRIIALLTVIVFGTCIVGCGTESQQEESGNSIFSVKEICDNCNQYNHNRITIKGRAKNFYKSDETEYGAYSLILEDIDTKSEVITCYFENDDLQALYTFEGTDYLEENDARRLITISGQFSFNKKDSMIACYLTECEVTAISSSLDDLLHQTDESSDTNEINSIDEDSLCSGISKEEKPRDRSDFPEEYSSLSYDTLGNIDEFMVNFSEKMNLILGNGHLELKEEKDNGKVIQHSYSYYLDDTEDYVMGLTVFEDHDNPNYVSAISINLYGDPLFKRDTESFTNSLHALLLPIAVFENCSDQEELNAEWSKFYYKPVDDIYHVYTPYDENGAIDIDMEYDGNGKYHMSVSIREHFGLGFIMTKQTYEGG